MPQTTDKFAIFPYSGMDAPDENILQFNQSMSIVSKA